MGTTYRPRPPLAKIASWRWIGERVLAGMMATIPSRAELAFPETPRDSALPRWLARLFVIATSVLLGAFEMSDYDIWWHLRTGELIPERGVPAHDWFSFPSADEEWIDVHWGFQLVASAAYSRFGSAGLVVGKALLAGIAVSIGLTAYRRNWPIATQVLIWIPAVFLMSSRFYERPEVLTLVFLATYLTVIFQCERRPGLLWILPPIQIVWANTHGLFILGPVVAGMAMIEAIARRRDAPGMSRRWAVTLVTIVAAGFVSPYGWKNYVLVYELWRKMAPEGKLYREHIAEFVEIPTLWRQGGSESPYVWILAGLWALGVLSCAIAWREIFVGRRLFRPIALAAFGWLSVTAVRNGAPFALVAATVISWNLGPCAWKPAWLAKSASWLAVAMGALATFFVASERWHAIIGGQRRIGLGERAFQYSHEAMAIAGAEGMPKRAAIMHFGHAAQYIHANGPERLVFMDGRLEVHSPRHFRDYLGVHDALTAATDDWENELARRGIDLLLLDGEHNAPAQATVIASSRWKLIHYDPVMAVFARPHAIAAANRQVFDLRDGLFTPARAASTDDAIGDREAAPAWWFRPPPEILKGPDDFAAGRLYGLAVALATRPASPRTAKLAATWRAVGHATAAARRRPFAPEPRRYLGTSLLLAAGSAPDAGEESPSPRREWDDVRGPLRAAGIFQLKKAIERGEDDFSANYYLAQAYEELGAIDLAAERLDRLAKRRARNRAQANLASMLASKRDQLRAKIGVGGKSRDESKPLVGAERFEALIARGDARKAIERSDEFAKEANSPEDVDKLGIWLLALGEIDRASRLYATEPATRVTSPSLLALRRGQVALAGAQFNAADDHLRDAERMTPDSPTASLLRAQLSLWTGNKDRFLSALDNAKSRAKNPADLTVFEELASLAPREHRAESAK